MIIITYIKIDGLLTKKIDNSYQAGDNEKKTIQTKAIIRLNIAKGTTDPGVDYFNQLLWFGLVGLVQQVWFGGLGMFGLVGLVWQVWFGRFGLVGLVWQM